MPVGQLTNVNRAIAGLLRYKCGRGSIRAQHGGRNRDMKYLSSAMLIVVGIIHLLPLSGVLGAERLATLYGRPFDEVNLEILMRHRAVLFGLLGAFLIVAAFKPALQPAAYVGGFISVLSFLYLAWAVGSYNAQVSRVFVADVVALGCLVAGVVAHLLAHRPALIQ